jgi:sterol desaturase/sphingolipid hydroxylase (fatty acid hydroxylase superfamily)
MDPESIITSIRQKLFAILTEAEFFLKVAITCTLVQQLIYQVLGSQPLGFIHQALLLWLTGSLSFYVFGFGIEWLIKGNQALADKLRARQVRVKKQAFPAPTAQAIVLGEMKSFAIACLILYLAPEARRGNDLLANFLWFLMGIIVADLCFYVCHWLMHRKPFLKIHLKHHEFQDTSSFVAAHKSWLESMLTTFTDLLPIFIFGYDINQLLAWILIGTAYNLEGHSSLSLFFIPSDFHDLHHTNFSGNYGIQGLWDKVFKTIRIPSYQKRIIFPSSYLKPCAASENALMNAGRLERVER